MAETLKGEFYLVLSMRTDSCNFKRLNAPKVSKNKPRLGTNEVMMKLRIEVPVTLFSKPTLEATLTVPDNKVSQTIITPEIQNNIQEAIKQSTGFDMRITVIEPEEKV